MAGNTTPSEDQSFIETSAAAVEDPDHQGKSSDHENCVKSSSKTRNSPLSMWWLEGLAIVAALLLLAVIMMILYHFDGKEQPNWPYWMNLNTVVSILSTMLRAQLLLVAAEAIGQYKWFWFHRPRSLLDINRFDEASRGLTGSLGFLLRPVKSYVALCSAFILVLSVAIGPFTQQTIRAVACEMTSHDESASVPVAQYLPYQTDISLSTYAGTSGASNAVVSPQMSIAVLGGIVGSSNQVNVIPVSCPTGNCDFPGPEEDSVSYSSLAVCSSCVDISEDIVATQKKSNIDGGPDYWWYNVSESDSSFLGIRERSDGILAASPYPFLNIQALEQSDSAANRYPPSTNVTFMSFTWAGCSQPTEYSDQIDWLDKMDCSSYSRFPGLQNKVGLVAANCSLDLCVRNYESKVRNGELQETTVSVDKDVIFVDGLNDRTNHVIIKSPCFLDGQRYDITNLSEAAYSPAATTFAYFPVNSEWMLVPVDCMFRTDEVFSRGIFEYMHDIFHTSCKLDKWGPGSEWIACSEEWWYKPLFNDGNADMESVSAAFENIALAMTARMRSTGMDAYGEEPGRAVGTVTRTTVCIEVYWPWLTLHMFLVALTGLVFALIVYDSRRHGDSQPIWKHSSLVPFFHGLRDEQRGHGTVAGTPAPLELSSMKEAAAGMVVQLQQCNEGYGFVISGISEGSVTQPPSYEPVSMCRSTDKKSPDVLVAPDFGPCSSASVSENLDGAH